MQLFRNILKWCRDNWKGIIVGIVLIMIIIVLSSLTTETIEFLKKGPILKAIIIILSIAFIVLLIHKKWLGDYWRIITVVLLLCIYLASLIIYLKLISPILNLEALILSTVTALATIGLAVITYSYAKSTKSMADANKKMAEEMRQQRYGDVLPIVDIKEQHESAEDKIRIGFDIESGRIPKIGLLCTLISCGLGPAINVCTFISTPTAERRQWNFGTLAVNDETIKERLFIEMSNGRGMLVSYYIDAYERHFESSREFIINKEGRSYKLGALKIRKLTKEEYSRILAG